MTVPLQWVTHPFGMTERDCPRCRKRQEWCGSLECDGADNGPGHWSHLSVADGLACMNLCEKPS